MASTTLSPTQNDRTYTPFSSGPFGGENAQASGSKINGYGHNIGYAYDDMMAGSGIKMQSLPSYPPIPSLAALPVDKSKTEPKPAYYKLQFGDDVTGFSYYVRTLSILIGRNVDKNKGQGSADEPAPPSVGDEIKFEQAPLDQPTTPERRSQPPNTPLLAEFPSPVVSTTSAAGAVSATNDQKLPVGDEKPAEDQEGPQKAADTSINVVPVASDDGSGSAGDEARVEGDITMAEPESALADPGVLSVPAKEGSAEAAQENELLSLEPVTTVANVAQDLSEVKAESEVKIESPGSPQPPPPPPPPPPTSSKQSLEHVDVDLGPLKSVSRNHAKIDYWTGLGCFCLEILGRNGAWVDDRYYVKGSTVPLTQGAQIQIATRIFSFILPPSALSSPVPSPYGVDTTPQDTEHALDDVPYPFNLPPGQVGYAEFYGEPGPGPASQANMAARMPPTFNAFAAADGYGLGIQGLAGEEEWDDEWDSDEDLDSWDAESRQSRERRRRARQKKEAEEEEEEDDDENAEGAEADGGSDQKRGDGEGEEEMDEDNVGKPQKRPVGRPKKNAKAPKAKLSADDEEGSTTGKTKAGKIKKTPKKSATQDDAEEGTAASESGEPSPTKTKKKAVKGKTETGPKVKSEPKKKKLAAAAAAVSAASSTPGASPAPGSVDEKPNVQKDVSGPATLAEATASASPAPAPAKSQSTPAAAGATTSAPATATAAAATMEIQRPFFCTELNETPGRPGHIIVNVPIPPSGAGPRPPPGPLIGLDGKPFIGPPPLKPTATFATIIHRALLYLPRGRGTLGEVCNWVAGEWEWFRLNVDAGWQNSIRHNLSLNKAFLKVPRIPEDDPESKGSVWIIDPHEGPAFEEKQRRDAMKNVGKDKNPDLKRERDRIKTEERARKQRDMAIEAAQARAAAAHANAQRTTAAQSQSQGGLAKPGVSNGPNTPATAGGQPRPAAARPQPVAARAHARPTNSVSSNSKGLPPKTKVTVSIQTLTPAIRAKSLINPTDAAGNPLPFACDGTTLVLDQGTFGHLTSDIIDKLTLLGAAGAVDVLSAWVINRNKNQAARAAQQANKSSPAGAKSTLPTKTSAGGAGSGATGPRGTSSVSPGTAAPSLQPKEGAGAGVGAGAKSSPASRPGVVAGGTGAGAGSPMKKPLPGPAPPGASLTKVISMIAEVANAKGDVNTVGPNASALLRYIRVVGVEIDLKVAERIWATGEVPPLPPRKVPAPSAVKPGAGAGAAGGTPARPTPNSGGTTSTTATPGGTSAKPAGAAAATGASASVAATNPGAAAAGSTTTTTTTTTKTTTTTMTPVAATGATPASSAANGSAAVKRKAEDGVDDAAKKQKVEVK